MAREEREERRQRDEKEIMPATFPQLKQENEKKNVSKTIF